MEFNWVEMSIRKSRQLGLESGDITQFTVTRSVNSRWEKGDSQDHTEPTTLCIVELIIFTCYILVDDIIMLPLPILVLKTEFGALLCYVSLPT